MEPLNLTERLNLHNEFLEQRKYCLSFHTMCAIVVIFCTVLFSKNELSNLNTRR